MDEAIALAKKIVAILENVDGLTASAAQDLAGPLLILRWRENGQAELELQNVLRAGQASTR